MSHKIHPSTPCCPHCAYSFTAPVRMHWSEMPWLLLLRRIYRCRTCGDRYLGRFNPLEHLVVLVRNRVM